MSLDNILENLERRRSGLQAYSLLLKACRSTDVSHDPVFQRKYAYFFRVRRNSEWREIYFRLFEACKSCEDVTFESILRRLYENTGRIEASFSSKMLALLYPEMPIWDSIVLKKLGCKAPIDKDRESRIQKTVRLYEKIVNWYRRFDQTPAAEQFVQSFDQAFPEYRNFSRTKKIDFLLWGSGDTDPFTSVQPPSES